MGVQEEIILGTVLCQRILGVIQQLDGFYLVRADVWILVTLEFHDEEPRVIFGLQLCVTHQSSQANRIGRQSDSAHPTMWLPVH